MPGFSGIVESVNGGTDDFPAERSQRLDEFIGEDRLARAINSVDPDANRMVQMNLRDPIRYLRYRS